jgi:hypothetical protein
VIEEPTGLADRRPGAEEQREEHRRRVTRHQDVVRTHPARVARTADDVRPASDQARRGAETVPAHQVSGLIGHRLTLQTELTVAHWGNP